MKCKDNLLLLSGSSKRNKEWIYRINQIFYDIFKDTIVHNYKHWEDDSVDINLDYELEIISKEVSNFEPYVIFAKSIGSVLALKGIDSQLLKPTRCIFVGLPLKIIIEDCIPFFEWLDNVNVPVVIIQNKNDPFGSINEVKIYIINTKNNDIKILEVPGDSHDYDDLDMLRRLI